MDRERQRQFAREHQQRRVAQAKAEGKQAVAWTLPQTDLAIVDQIKEAHAYTNRADTVSMMINVIWNNPRLRKEFGL